MKSKMKRGVALLIGLMLALNCRWGTGGCVNAATYTVSGLKNIGMVNSDFLGNGVDHSALIYWYMNGTGKISYCLQYGYLLSSGQRFDSVGEALSSMTDDQIRQLKYCLYYGYQAGAYGICPHGDGYTCQEEWIPYAATQAMVWLIVAGKYDDSEAVDKWGRIVADSTGYADRVWAEYQRLYADMENAMGMKVPAIAGINAATAPEHTMEWDSSKGVYTVTVTDTTGTIDLYNWSLPAAVNVTKHGNQITFSTTQELSGELVKLSAKSGSAANREMSSLVFLQPSDAGKQQQVQYASVTYDPLDAWLYLKTGEKYGNCCFVKKDDLGMPLAGCRFELLDSEGKEVDAWVTDETGIHELKGVLKKGESYTLRETDVPLGYERAEDVAFTVSEAVDWQEIITANAKIGATICINKFSDDGSGTDGTEFSLLTTKEIDGAEPVTDQGKTYYVLQTGMVSGGKVCFDDLDATGAYEYLLIETKSVGGKQLLPEPIRLGTLPVAAKAGVSAEYTGRSQTKEDITYLYDITYQVVNTGTMVLPLTGAAGNSLVLVSSGCVAMVLIAVMAAEKRKRGII
ncbi:MAG: Cys-Gln thioester bond-forming surface protein [Lachnospiraceae bacterium]|nr:Cys-Gln thioester bond-forming surface protein [Lachnospiraceae bacterium]